jgi:hypothetical protein
MQQAYARRKFLKNVALTSTGIMFLSSTSVLQAFNTKEILPEELNATSSLKVDMRKQWLSNNYVTIIGKLFSKDKSIDLSKTSVEVWHLSPDLKEEYRANVQVHANGEYSFVTDFPGRAKHSNAKVYFKFSNQSKVVEAVLTIDNYYAYINDQYYADNLALEEKLLPKTQIIKNEKYITFNTII